jgi:cobalamin-dependent methionine synthase I
LLRRYGIEPEDIIIDPLVFPCATGDANYVGGAWGCHSPLKKSTCPM